MRKIFCAAFVSAAVVAGAAAAAMAQSYPERPITIVVAYAAGGSVDAVTRVLAREMGETLGQSVVVENQPGAGGAVAATQLMREEADGYTLMSTTSTTLTFDPHAGDLEFAVADFDPIGVISVFQEAFVTRTDSEWQTMEEVLERAKSTPMTYGSSTQIDRVIASIINSETGAQLTPVPTGGGADVMTAVLGGHVDLGYSAGIHASHVEAGDMIVLASLGEDRLVASPDAPTLQELGIDAASINYNVLVAPAGLPEDVHQTLVDAFEEAWATDAVQDVLEARKLGKLELTGSELGERLEAHSERYQQMLEAAE